MNYLKWCRLNLGLSQIRVAEEVGISQGMYCDIERGRRKPSPKVHLRIATVLRQPVEEFTARLYGIDRPKQGKSNRKAVVA